MVNARKKKQKKGLKMEGKSQKSQVTICYVCGDKGFTNALIGCSKCLDKVAHQYCLGVVPGSIDDTFTWLCEFCSMVPMVSESAITVSDSFSSKKTEEISIDIQEPLKPKSKNEIPIVDDQPQPLQILLPVSYNTSSEQRETGDESDDSEQIARTLSSSIAGDIATASPLRQPENIFSESVLLVSPSGEIFISSRMDTHVASPSHGLAPSSLSMKVDGMENEPSVEHDENI